MGGEIYMKKTIASIAGGLFAVLALAVAAAPSFWAYNHPEAPAELKEKLSK
jgi:cyclic lactone autoinducer peptide